MPGARPQLIPSPAILQGEASPVRSRWAEAPNGAPSLIGRSPGIDNVVSDIELVVNRTCNVLIEGETGTGKEVVARSIHERGGRSRGPWVAVNCGAIPESLLEAELFGHVRGAFTGAIQSRAGKFELANRGTIFLDEIAEMPYGLQAKLLRVLQEREVERLGGNEKLHLDIRVIAATNAGLADRVRRGLFREDLFYRLNVFPITVPPLRERREDIPLLAQYFLDKVCRIEGCAPKTLDTDAVHKLGAHNWPGNVRELENVIESGAIISGRRAVVTSGDLRLQVQPSLSSQSGSTTLALHLPTEGLDFQAAVEEFEHRLLTHALTRVRGNKTAAAELLGLKRTTLAAKMRVLGSRMPQLVA